MPNLFAELKRRNIFRVAGVYAVIGWLLAQVAGVLENAMNMPSWFDTMVVSGLLLGFPIAMVLAWAFEMTPEGIKSSQSAPEGESIATKTGTRLDVAILAGIGLVIALAGWQQFTKPDVVYVETKEAARTALPDSANDQANAPTNDQANDQTSADPQVDPASIAVLPFVDLSPSGDQEYFSDGIAEEILNVLVRVKPLKVASRTSAFGFKGKEALGIPHIAEQLGVRHVLEGSVRKAGNTVRITAQLIDADTDQHLWSETYDRSLSVENLFAIQDEIANAIVSEMGVIMNVEDGDSTRILVAADTKNLDAYELYLKAHQGFLIRNQDNIPDTISLFEAAVAADPDFARAWAGLAAIYSVAPSWQVTGRDYLKLGTEAAQKAISLNPEMALPYASLGNILGDQLPIDYSKVFLFFNKAIELNPQDTTTLLWRGVSYIQTGFFDKAITDLEQCRQIDPAYGNCGVFLALAHLYSGDTQTAFELFEKNVEIGATSQLFAFIPTLVAEGENLNALLVIRWVDSSFTYSYNNPSAETQYRSLTDPQFDFEAERRSFEIEVEALTGAKPDWQNSYEAALVFRKYDALKPNPHAMDWWDRNRPDLFKSPHRKRLIREMGIYDYWRAHGFPAQCRPQGTDDFWCDDLPEGN